MATDKVEIVFTAKDLTDNGFRAVAAGMSSVLSVGKKLTSQIFSLNGAIGALGIGYVANGFIDTANTTESLHIRLNTLLGSVEEGNRLFDEMTRYASTVSFSYDEVMASATTLAGVLEGGVDEISAWMPLIGDLAATSGLTIQETTEQIQRMLSAGAASADLFRERGILAMLGFQAGVSYTAEETRNKLIESFNDADSKFRGASTDLAETLTGIWSMIGDKWFNIKSEIMDAGLLDYLKSISAVIDDRMGQALDNTKQNASVWVDVITTGATSIMMSIAGIADKYRDVKIGVNQFEIAWLYAQQKILSGLVYIGEKLDWLARLEGALGIIDYSDFKKELDDTKVDVTELGFEIQKLAFETEALANAPLATDSVKKFADDVKAQFEELQRKAKETRKKLAAEQGGEDGSGDKGPASNSPSGLEVQRGTMEERLGLLDEQLQAERALYEEYYSDWVKMQEDATSYQKDLLTASFGFKQSLQQGDVQGTLTALTTMTNASKTQSRAMFNLNKAAALAHAMVALPPAVIESYRNAGGYPWGIIPAGLMAAAGAAEIAKITSTQFGQAHGGLTYADKDKTINIRAGERVIAPEQNTDLTQFLKSQQSGQSTSSGATIGTINISMFENATPRDLASMGVAEISRLVEEKLIPAFDRAARRGFRLNGYARV